MDPDVLQGDFEPAVQRFLLVQQGRASIEACVRASLSWFRAEAVHPTIGMYPGVLVSLRVVRYARRLDEAGSVGFSVSLAETRMATTEWSALGTAIRQRGIALAPASS